MTTAAPVDSSEPRVGPIVAAVTAWLALGPAGGVTAAAAVIWAYFGHGDRERVLSVAGLAALATAVSWLAAGTPAPLEVVSFVNDGGRDWMDAIGRAAIALVVVALTLPSDATHVASSAVGGTPRLPEADRLRAAAIIAVVLIHGLPFRAPITDYVDYWLSDLLRFSVAMLFFVSGWLLPPARTGRAWLWRRLLRIVPAYLLASGLVLSLATVSPLIDTRPVLSSLLLGDAVGPYYFVHVLLALTIVTPLIQRLHRHTQVWLFVAAASTSLMIELADLPLYLHNHLSFTWLPFYLGGHLLRPLRSHIARAPEALKAALVTATTVGALALALLPIETTPRRLVTWLLMWAVIGLMLVLSLTSRRPITSTTRRLSEQSYLIYLYHAPIVAGVAGAFGSSILTLRPVAGTVIAVGLCLLAGSMARIAMPMRAGRWLGA